MKHTANGLRLSATDLANHLGCRHLTCLDREAAEHRLKPPLWRDPALEVLQERGLRHEQAYLDQLRSQGASVITLEDEHADTSAFERTCEAMRTGTDLIVQATLASGRWFGRADILRRVHTPSALGEWSYEVIDTKLSSETRAGTILQLCLYSDIVAEVQAQAPASMHVVTPVDGFTEQSYRLHDYLAYYRLVWNRLEWAVDGPPDLAATYPDPVPQCDICRWWSACDRRRRDDDHLSLVAGMSGLHIRELQTHGVGRLEQLARVALPLPWKPARGHPDAYVRIREQARVQQQARDQGEPVFELLPPGEEQGLCRLPEPCPGDLFFDIEGDAFVDGGGLEYLLGWVTVNQASQVLYEELWSLDREAEKRHFEQFVDMLMARWQRHPDFHVYHYAAYEPSALKRLMGRHGTREDAVDQLLRGERFVDLMAVVKHTVRAGIERYSIKELEVFFDYQRDMPLRDASLNLRDLERALELNQPEAIGTRTRDHVALYNRDDCVATWHLRNWLERLRDGLIDTGQTIARPTPHTGEASAAIDERAEQVARLHAELTRDLPADAGARSETQHARWLLANMLDWYRREEKAPWWEYFRLAELSVEDAFDEQSAIAYTEFVETTGGTDNCPIHRYRFAPQDTRVRKGDTVHVSGPERLGTVEAIDAIACTVDIRKSSACAALHPQALFSHSVIPAKVLESSLLRLAAWVVDHGVDAAGPWRAARDLLLRAPPRRTGGGASDVLLDAGESTLTGAIRLALSLDHGVLPIQGPPGAGKTYTGARMIVAAVQAGLKVGVTAVSHKVIGNLLDGVLEAAAEAGVDLHCMRKVNQPRETPPGITETRSNDAVLSALTQGSAQVGAGTAWLWAREDFFQAVDLLFVDEAGQMAISNVLAVAGAARNLVLLGDPQQLEQPQQATHPDGTDVSALHHLLLGHHTIAPERGLFLAETWRLHPAVCAFTSEIFYDGLLRSHAGLERQAIDGDGRFAGAGLYLLSVAHAGNQSSAPEEVSCVHALVDELLADGAGRWTDKDGCSTALALEDVLIIAPYNAQVDELQRALPEARVGTVDKFQGQEAPVVIYSMTTSSPLEAPHGMEFLYSLNRLNVATSRARCTCVLVASAALFEPQCRTPRQMQLANAFCRYRELATVFEAST